MAGLGCDTILEISKAGRSASYSHNGIDDNFVAGCSKAISVVGPRSWECSGHLQVLPEMKAEIK